ncbi:MAG: glutamate--cysteine ligase [Myxococcales bacterium]|nr:glutamate--cysteine ligase [Myxococcales bacterium]
MKSTHDLPLELIAAHRDGATQRADWLTGAEHELLAVDADGRAPKFDGDQGIERVLLGIGSEVAGLDGMEERGRIIALKGRGGSVTLEPGGQVELSGAAHKDLHALASETQCYQSALERVAEDLGLRFFAMGLRPVLPVPDVPRMPKARYRVMEDVMPSLGSRSLEMMFSTATIQCNLDYSDEADMVAKFRCGALLSPVLTALVANSPYQAGQRTGLMSTRQAIWDETATARSGRFPWMVEGPISYRDYATFASDQPLLFRQQGDQLSEADQQSFLSHFKKGELDLEDWALHLTTLFPEVRLKHMLELRGADGGTGDLVIAVNAFWTGILYDDEARNEAIAQLTSLDGTTWDQLAKACQKDGLRAQTQGLPPVAEIAAAAVGWAKDGLKRRARCNEAGEDESIWLRPLEQFLELGASPAELLIARFGDDALAARSFLAGDVQRSPWLA